MQHTLGEAGRGRDKAVVVSAHSSAYKSVYKAAPRYVSPWSKCQCDWTKRGQKKSVGQGT